VGVKPEKVFAIKFSTLYPLYVRKAVGKGRSADEVDRVICWLTGYDASGLRRQISRGVDLRSFFDEAPRMNPDAAKVAGVVCGVRVEEVADPLMRNIRRLDKLVDDLARGRALESLLGRFEAGARVPGRRKANAAPSSPGGAPSDSGPRRRDVKGPAAKLRQKRTVAVRSQRGGIR
jgi:hypothetical protein